MSQAAARRSPAVISVMLLGGMACDKYRLDADGIGMAGDVGLALQPHRLGAGDAVPHRFGRMAHRAAVRIASTAAANAGEGEAGAGEAGRARQGAGRCPSGERPGAPAMASQAASAMGRRGDGPGPPGRAAAGVAAL